MSDIAVVGQFAGSLALGSVGSCATLVSLFTGLLIGMGGGINAIAARYIRVRETVKTSKRTVHTAFLLSLIYGIVVMIFGLFTVKGILGILGTKEELMQGAVLYMKVYLIGTPALALYNFGNGILSASGDSKRSLYCSPCRRNFEYFTQSVLCHSMQAQCARRCSCQCDIAVSLRRSCASAFVPLKEGLFPLIRWSTNRTPAIFKNIFLLWAFPALSKTQFSP